MLGMENGERYGAVDIEFNLGSLSFFVFLALLQVNTPILRT
jgi:hypothetical protein